MLIPTPFHPRTSALCLSYAWKDWAGYAAVCNYDRHSEREYFALRHGCALFDVSPLYKMDVFGPDSGKALSRVVTRNIEKLRVNRVSYGCWCDDDGKVLDDGTIARLSDGHFRVTSSEPWTAWFRTQCEGFDVEVQDTSKSLGSLALQGPTSGAVLGKLVDFELERMRFFGARATKLGGIDIHITRTGYTGDLGYELWIPAESCLTVWDLVVEAGKDFGLQPAGLDALDVGRLEAGFILQGVDYFSARDCTLNRLKSTPLEIGLGWAVDLDGRDFVGSRALAAETLAGPSSQLVGLDIAWDEIEHLSESYRLAPHLGPYAWREPLPVYGGSGGKRVGHASSGTWSPLLKKSLALATVPRKYTKPGTGLCIEYTVEYERHRVSAVVSETPFFDPVRKRSFVKAQKSSDGGSHV